MKHLTFSLLILLTAFFVIQGCNKNGLPPANGELSASSLYVEINQPDSLRLTGAASTDSVKWSVTPAGFDSLVTKNNTALVFFKKSGTYTVTAINKAVPSSINIKVSDSVYHGGQQYVNVPLTGDQVTLEPRYYKSLTSDSTDIYFVVTTKNSYCERIRLNTADSIVNNNYFMDFLSVTEDSPCIGSSNPIIVLLHFNNQPVVLANGNYPLTIKLNGNTYTGSFDVTSSGVSFNWSYNSGVVISPLQVQPIQYNY